MKLIIQRVKAASVKVSDQIVGQIDQGLLVFLGIKTDDDESKIEYLVNKLLHMRIFKDEQDKMNNSLQDIDGKLLIVSQFTLYGNLTEGRRPDFKEAAGASKAIALYNLFIEKAKQALPGKIQTGEFGALMEISLINDGPVTFILER